jgi:hypothetical protein
VPVYGERSAARLAAFQSLDVRVDKLWELKRVDLTGYLEVQNVTYAKNVEVMGWNFDYTEETPITGFPPLPVFGVKASRRISQTCSPPTMAVPWALTPAPCWPTPKW